MTPAPEDWEALQDHSRNLSEEELFTNAWRSLPSNSEASLAAQKALRAFSTESSELQDILKRLEPTIHDLLDLRLDGNSIFNHSIQASKLADFIKKTSVAVNEITKSTNGLRRIPDRILVLAPSMGSVRVIFTVQSSPFQTDQLDLAQTGTREERAIRTLVSLWLQAEDTNSDVVDSAIHQLNGKAQRSVRSLTKLISERDWNISGDLVSRTGERASINLTSQGLNRILDATSQVEVEETVERLVGYVDGWTWSRQTMRFRAIDSGRPIEALVPDPLSPVVANWMTNPTERVVAIFDLLKKFPRGDRDFYRSSYTLKSLAPYNEQLELPNR